MTTSTANNAPSSNPVDVETRNEGSIFLFSPLTDDAKIWFQLHTGDEAQWFGGSLVVEWRYAEDIVAGLVNDGLNVQGVY